MMSKYRTFVVLSKLLGLAFFGSMIVSCGSSYQPVGEPSQPTVGDTPQPTVAERLQAVLDQAVTNGLPGAALAVRGDNVNFTGVAGVEEIATEVPLNVNHRFYLASVGKTYTAVATVRLAADGLLNLDDPITTWLPATITDRIPSSKAINIRSLLNHTSGIFDFQNDAEEWLETFIVDTTRHWTNADVLPFFLDKPLHFEPTTDYRYSNSNYVLVALIAEAASGLSIQDIIRYYILEPLGLQDTAHGNEANGLPSLAHGYVEFNGELIDVYPWYTHYAVADGGIQSSAADVAEFVRGVLTSDTVLNDAMRAELLTPSGVGIPPSVYGLGIQIIAGDVPENFIYAHDGKDPGSRAEFLHVTSADKSVTIALCASASLGDYDFWYQQFVQAVIEVLNDADVMPSAKP